MRVRARLEAAHQQRVAGERHSLTIDVAERGGHEERRRDPGLAEDHAFLEQVLDPVPEVRVEQPQDDAQPGAVLGGQQRPAEVSDVVVGDERHGVRVLDAGLDERELVVVAAVHHRDPERLYRRAEGPGRLAWHDHDLLPERVQVLDQPQA